MAKTNIPLLSEVTEARSAHIEVHQAQMATANALPRLCDDCAESLGIDNSVIACANCCSNCEEPQPPPEPTKLYRITFDGEPDYIEAVDFGAAIEIWRAKLIAENEPGDFDDDVEPESVNLEHDRPVLR